MTAKSSSAACARRSPPPATLAEEDNEVRITTFAAAQLEAEAAEAGLAPLARHRIPATDIHVGSTVVVLRKED